MKKISDLQNKESELLNKKYEQEVQIQKTEQELSGITKQIEELKEQNDYGSFKFVHANLPLIIKKIAPKHKTPPPREINFDSSGTGITASIPWTEEKCSDENPCNTNVCPRCTLLHFYKVLGNLLAEYYTK
ncbi:MAG: hypothetical protein ACOC80_10300 [Petrotogales bacterium]